ncbi:MAG: urea ABC transporter permease subunit UrtB [SAR324 cluster bacterium]|nr:urea ABC transporter permease subunit UrtB [SAR324 cluster bacterium]
MAISKLSLVFALICFLSWSMGSSPVQASEKEQLLQGLVSKKRAIIIKTIKVIGKQSDPSYLNVLEALKSKKLKVTSQKQVLIKTNQKNTYVDPLNGETVVVPSSSKLKGPRINNSVRRVLSQVIAQLQLESDVPAVRLSAAEELEKRPTPSTIATIEKALEKETDPEVKDALLFALALTELKSPDKQKKLKAMSTLGNSGSRKAKNILAPFIEKDEDGNYKEEDPEIREAAYAAFKSIERKVLIMEMVGHLFRGLSLGSVLLLVSLGLAITFGLMKVINMAHGEMLMIGAYSTYVVQNLFHQFFPDYFSSYLVFAIPFGFLVSAIIGMILERGVLRYLYGRPLETLLATWGISLFLIQTTRLLFGAQNVEVANPHWLSGGIHVSSGLVLPFNRIAIIFFVAFVVFMVWYLFQKTSLGLKVRAVTQNRSMASCLGISSSRTDMWTFGLGSGIAGLGGVALSQLGNVGPELGQGYIVDSFMVVVLGGVGKIIGTVVSALGLGVAAKFLEPVSGAVFAKIMILVFIIGFIQKRPQGLFAIKGRAVEE